MVPECKPEWNREAVTVFSRLPSLRRLQATPPLQTSLSATGSQANPQDVSEVRQATKQLPILIGSGITPENVNEFSNADGFIVGSYLKENGFWSAEMDEKRVEKMVQAVQK